MWNMFLIVSFLFISLRWTRTILQSGETKAKRKSIIFSSLLFSISLSFFLLTNSTPWQWEWKHWMVITLLIQSAQCDAFDFYNANLKIKHPYKITAHQESPLAIHTRIKFSFVRFACYCCATRIRRLMLNWIPDIYIESISLKKQKKKFTEKKKINAHTL